MTTELPKQTIEIKVIVDQATGQVIAVQGPLHQKMYCIIALSMAQMTIANHHEPVIRPETSIAAPTPSKRDIIPFSGGRG